jgi:hypothetical protein
LSTVRERFVFVFFVPTTFASRLALPVELLRDADGRVGLLISVCWSSSPSIKSSIRRRRASSIFARLALVLASFSKCLVEALLLVWMMGPPRTRERIHEMSRLPWRMKAVIIIVTGVLPLLDPVRIGRTRLTFLRMGVVPRSRRSTPMRRPLAIGMNPVESFVVASRFRIKGPKTMRCDVEAGRRRVISRGPHVIRG